ncbi:hypothetical protein CVT24_006436 [Panaeolus cyanescens]|uniref:FAD/NAD(P)-binding domain-containing protein n=1 Tax=Panaeolus cyanescens TaxID=181874 RepID=A0A409VZ77_9AGAR|nr:hypothetical protein CVT24_006436 [Panaeolus cyanescens]
MAQNPVLQEPIGIIGTGVAGLITAYVLTLDGFTNVTLITRDETVGGTWARERVYPGLHINSVHNEYRFSALPMPPPENAAESGGRLSGKDMCRYMEKFYEMFLKDKANFIFKTNVLNIHRDEPGKWRVNLKDRDSGEEREMRFARIVLATGGCSNPNIPEAMSQAAANRVGFKDLVVHSSKFAENLDKMMEATMRKDLSTDGSSCTASEGTTAAEHKDGSKEESQADDEGVVLVVGGGKSAQDAVRKMTLAGRKVVMVYTRTDTFLASKSPAPDFLRKSRLIGVLAGHCDLNSRLERFLHKTTIGAAITRAVWRSIEEESFKCFDIPQDSPLRLTHNLFWGVRSSDEGKVMPECFHALAMANKFEIIAPARAVGYSEDGESVLLSNGRSLKPKVVVLCTGYQSSWSGIFTPEMAKELGVGRHEPLTKITPKWDYKSLKNPPKTNPDHYKWVTSIYRGIVPAKNILNRDFAIGGALFTGSHGYTDEVAAHWIASYFRGDNMRLPSTVEAALEVAERGAAWMKVRYPDSISWINDSYSTSLDFWTWPQAADQLLDDMYVRSGRSGGNWLNWTIKVIDLSEISTLTQERKDNRERAS